MIAGRSSARRLIRIVGWTSAAVLLVAGLIVLRAWYPQIPRPIRRGVAEWFLRGALVAYALAWLLSGPGSACLAAILLRARGHRVRRPRIARGLAICVSLLFSLILLESASAAFRAISTRLPRLPTTFPERSDPKVLRVGVIGESSALGEPFRPWVSVGQIVGWKLQEALPDRRVEVEILAKLGASLEDMHAALRGLRRRPDLLIVYSGHNEFVARFEEERDPDLGEEPGGRLLRPLYQFSLHSPFCRLVYATISRNRLDEAPPLRNRHRLIDPPVCSPSEAEEIRADFAARLDAIVDWSLGIGSLPVLVISPANDAGFQPSRSCLPPSASAADRSWVEAKFRDAEATPSNALDDYRAVADRFPGFAEARFRIGRILERSGQVADASREYEAARDADGLPIRFRTSFQEVYRSVAKRKGAILVDGLAVLRSASPSGLLDDHVLIDAHHPTLLGTAALAGAVLRSLAERRRFGLPGSSTPVGPAEVADRFGLDASRWAEACRRTSIHYRRTAGYRFDPAERLSKAERFERAARRLDSGETPEGPEFPGIGPVSGTPDGGRKAGGPPR